MKITEADLSRYTLHKIEALGLFGWRMPISGVARMTVNRGMIFQKSPIKGMPDYQGVTRAGQMWALELKSEKGRLSDDQKGWIDRLTRHNVLVGVARSIAEIDAFLNDLKLR